MQYLGRCPCAIPELWAAQEAFRTRVCQTHRPWMLLGPSCSKHAVNCPASTSASVIPQELRCLKPAATDAEKNDTCTWGRFVAPRLRPSYAGVDFCPSTPVGTRLEVASVTGYQRDFNHSGASNTLRTYHHIYSGATGEILRYHTVDVVVRRNLCRKYLGIDSRL